MRSRGLRLSVRRVIGMRGGPCGPSAPDVLKRSALPQPSSISAVAMLVASSTAATAWRCTTGMATLPAVWCGHCRRSRRGPVHYFRVVLYAERVRCIKTRKGRPPQNARFKVEKSRHVFAIATNPWAIRSERSEYAFLPQLCLSSFRQCSAVRWQALC